MYRISTLLFITFFLLQACNPDESESVSPTLSTDQAAGGGGNSGGLTGDTTSIDSITNNILYITDPQLGLDDSLKIESFIANNNWIITNGYDDTLKRYIILEEFTGHRNRNSPNGAREIARLKTIYGDQLIPISIHITKEFAAPQPSGSSFRTDFRLQSLEGETYRNSLNIGVLPQGVISRSTQSGRQINQWESDFSSLKNDIPTVTMELTNYYDSTLNALRTQVDINWKDSLTEEYNLQLFVLESKIIDWQLDGTTAIANYEHNYVLRKVVNGTFGTKLTVQQSTNPNKIQYIYNIDPSWNKENIQVVAFIFNRDPNSYEVIQANTAFIE